MDPFGITIALALLGGRLLTRSARKEAERDYNDAVSTYRSSRWHLQSAQKDCVDSLNILGVNRVACLSWQLPRIKEAARKLGLMDRFFGKKAGIFSGRTLGQVMNLVRKSRAAIIPPSGVFDNSVMIASGSALVVEGVQFLDKVGLVHAPLLHSTVHDVVASLPTEHASGFADALGGVGDWNVADLFGDALVVFGLFKSLYNLKRADTLGNQASDIRHEAYKLDRAASTVLAIRSRAQELSGDLEETSYEAFKWTIIAEEAARLKSRNARWAAPAWIGSRLREATSRLWANLQQPAAA